MKLPQRAAAAMILLISAASSCSIGKDPKNPDVKYLQMQFAGGSFLFHDTDTIAISTSTSCEDDSLRYRVDQSSPQAVPMGQTIILEAAQYGIGAHTVYASAGVCSSQVGFTVLPSAPPTEIGYRIVNTFPHATTSYTQGLVFENGILYESTGMYRQSRLMEVNIATGKPHRAIDLDGQYFGEGLAMAGDRLYQLTWREKTGFVYRKSDFGLIKTFEYPTEGWGLAFNGTDLILSDGSHYLYYLDTATLQIRKQLPVYDHHGPVARLNELEWVDSCIYANVYMSDHIVKIDERTGAVTGKLLLGGLLSAADEHPQIDVLNGIARNSGNGNYYITGKNWPKLFEVELIEDKK